MLPTPRVSPVLRARMFALSCSMLLLAAGPAVSAQEVILRGRVLAADSKAPLFGALVVSTRWNQGVLTDSLGFFALRLNRTPTYKLQVTQMGYATLAVELPIEAEAREFTVELRPDAVALEGLTVLTERLGERRRGRYGVADVLDQADLRRAPEGSAYELVRRTLPFVELCDRQSEALCLTGRSTVNGRRQVSVCIDGRKVPAEMMETVLSGVDPRALYLAESYARTGEVRLYSPAYIQRLIAMDSELPPLSFGCSG